MTMKADQNPPRAPKTRGRYLQRAIAMPLAALRTATRKTQSELAESSGIDQGDVSRLEQRQDLDDTLVSTLRRYVEALGGKLEIVAVFPKGHRITIAPAEKQR